MTNPSSSKIKLGLVLSAVPGYSETFFRNKIKGLQQNGIDVTLFVDTPYQGSYDLDCKVVVAPSFGGGVVSKLYNVLNAIIKCFFVNPKRSLKLLRLDKKDNIGLKQCIKNVIRNQYLLNSSLDWLHFGYGMLAHNRENVAQTIDSKMAVSYRGFDLYLSPLKHKNCYDILFSKRVKYHVLSNKMKIKLIDNGIVDSTIEVITPAIDISVFKNADRKIIKKGILNLVCISRLHWVKGVNYLLDALRILKEEGVSFRCAIIGDGEDRERLIFAAHQLNILDYVTFTGRLTQDKVVEYLNNTDLYLQYSIQEGFGNAALEAQAMGIPCVVSDADGLQENVLHKKTGLVVPRRNPEALAQAIQDLNHLEIEKRQLMTDFAIQRVRNDFNLDKQIALFLEFYSN